MSVGLRRTRCPRFHFRMSEARGPGRSCAGIDDQTDITPPTELPSMSKHMEGSFFR